jgi:hypothetical protein
MNRMEYGTFPKSMTFHQINPHRWKMKTAVRVVMSMVLMSFLITRPEIVEMRATFD